MNPPLLKSHGEDCLVNLAASSGHNQPERPATEVSLMEIATSVLWLGCVMVGGLGFWLPYGHARLPEKEPAPIEAEKLNVELTQDPAVPPDSAPPPDVPQPPPTPDAVIPPDAPPLVPVAKPSPTLAFALPVEGPTREVEAKQASHARPTQAAAVARPSVQQLTYGQGEGKQPAPDYPRECILGRRQGSVRIRFRVGEDGRVSTAQIVGSCAWPMLNQAALRAVRDSWQFHPGQTRIFEVAVNFNLNNKP